MDSEPAVHGETEEMDIDGDDSDIGIVDILPSGVDREREGGIPGVRTVGDMYGDGVLSVYRGDEEEQMDSAGHSICRTAGAEVQVLGRGGVLHRHAVLCQG